MTQTVICANQTEEYLDLDYKTLDYMLIGGNAEEYDSAKALFDNYDARDLDDKGKISAAHTPLYVIHNFNDIVLEYSPVYDSSLNLVGFLD